MEYNIENIKLAIDNESVNIYYDNGDDKEPIHICYWHIEEWGEDCEVAIPIFKAIELFYTDKKELLYRLSNINK